MLRMFLSSLMFFCKYILAIPTRDQKASTVARVLVAEWFSKLGAPARIHSDQGRNFESAFIQQLRSLCNIKKISINQMKLMRALH